MAILAAVAGSPARTFAQTAFSQPWITASSTVNRDTFQSGLGATGGAGLPVSSDFGPSGSAGVVLGDGMVQGPDLDVGQPYNTDRIANVQYSANALCASIGGPRRRPVVYAARDDAQASDLVLAAFSDVPKGLIVTEADLGRVDRRCYQQAPASLARNTDVEPGAKKSDLIGALIAALDVGTVAQTP